MLTWVSEAMYKRRFNIWGIGKNAKRKPPTQHGDRQGQTDELQLQDSERGSSTRATSSEATIKLEHTQPQAMPFTYCRKRSPEPPSSGLYSPDYPGDLLLVDRWMLAVQNYVPAAFEMGLWKLQPGGTIVFNQQLIGWYNRTRSCQLALAAGETKHAFRILGTCIEEFKDLMRSQDPLLVLFIFQGLFPISRHSPEAATVVLRYVRDIARVVHPPAHPMRLMMDYLYQMGLEELGRSAGELLKPYLALLFRVVGPHIEPLAELMALISSTLGTPDPKMLAVATKTHKGTYERIAAYGEAYAFEFLGLKLAYTWNLVRRGLLAEAQSATMQVLESEEAPKHPNIVASCHQLAFHIAFLEEDHERMVAAARRRVKYSVQTFGLGSYVTLDALSSLEAYLRRIGDDIGADEAYSNLLVATREVKRTRAVAMRPAKRR